MRIQLLVLLSLACILAIARPAPTHASPGTMAFDTSKAAAALDLVDPQAATRALLEAVPSERRSLTRAYARGNYLFEVLDYVIGSVLILGLVLFTGLSARMRDLAGRMTGSASLQAGIYWVQFFALTSLLGFPLSYLRGFEHETKYGLLHQPFSGWMRDQLVAHAMGLVLIGLLLMLLYAVVRRAGGSWWWRGWLFVCAGLLIGQIVAPVFIAPAFNKFTPIQDQGLRQSILAVAHAHGVPAKDVFEMDAGKRTDRIGAYVNGAFGTMRIVVFDNTLRRCTPAQVRAIVGHEMGHYVLNHVWIGFAYDCAMALLAFLFLRWGFGRAVAGWPRMGIRGVADPAGLPLALLLFSTFLFFTGPFDNALTRHDETAADNFSLQAVGDPDAMATAFLMLGEYRDLDPSPAAELVFYNHPSGRTRILNAMIWKARHRPHM